jgi:hypothetical protein
VERTRGKTHEIDPKALIKNTCSCEPEKMLVDVVYASSGSNYNHARTRNRECSVNEVSFGRAQRQVQRL